MPLLGFLFLKQDHIAQLISILNLAIEIINAAIEWEAETKEGFAIAAVASTCVVATTTVIKCFQEWKEAITHNEDEEPPQHSSLWCVAEIVSVLCSVSSSSLNLHWMRVKHDSTFNPSFMAILFSMLTVYIHFKVKSVEVQIRCGPYRFILKKLKTQGKEIRYGCPHHPHRFRFPSIAKPRLIEVLNAVDGNQQHTFGNLTAVGTEISWLPLKDFVNLWKNPKRLQSLFLKNSVGGGIISGTGLDLGFQPLAFKSEVYSYTSSTSEDFVKECSDLVFFVIEDTVWYVYRRINEYRRPHVCNNLNRIIAQALSQSLCEQVIRRFEEPNGRYLARCPLETGTKSVVAKFGAHWHFIEWCPRHPWIIDHQPRNLESPWKAFRRTPTFVGMRNLPLSLVSLSRSLFPSISPYHLTHADLGKIQRGELDIVLHY